jgi:hypothetical protein
MVFYEDLDLTWHNAILSNMYLRVSCITICI